MAGSFQRKEGHLGLGEGQLVIHLERGVSCRKARTWRGGGV